MTNQHEASIQMSLLNLALVVYTEKSHKGGSYDAWRDHKPLLKLTKSSPIFQFIRPLKQTLNSNICDRRSGSHSSRGPIAKFNLFARKAAAFSGITFCLKSQHPQKAQILQQPALRLFSQIIYYSCQTSAVWIHYLRTLMTSGISSLCFRDPDIGWRRGIPPSHHRLARCMFAHWRTEPCQRHPAWINNNSLHFLPSSWLFTLVCSTNGAGWFIIRLQVLKNWIQILRSSVSFQ